jgi:hypothetical protein
MHQEPAMEKVPIKIDDAFAVQVVNSAVGVLKLSENNQRADVTGSGTFVQLTKVKGILTAAHVITNLPTTGLIGLVRSPTRESALQNMRLDMTHTDRETLLYKKEGDAPDMGFLTLPDHIVAIIEAQGGVFYNLEKPRKFAPSSPSNQMTEAYALVGVVDEWSEETPGIQPKTKKKVVGGLLGAAQVTRRFQESDTELVEVTVDYSSSSRVPTSYAGVSGGALWQLHVELTGQTIVTVGKKLHGIAFRQSDDHTLVVCNGPPSIETLIAQIKKRWPASH